MLYWPAGLLSVLASAEFTTRLYAQGEGACRAGSGGAGGGGARGFSGAGGIGGAGGLRGRGGSGGAGGGQTQTGLGLESLMQMGAARQATNLNNQQANRLRQQVLALQQMLQQQRTLINRQQTMITTLNNRLRSNESSNGKRKTSSERRRGSQLAETTDSEERPLTKREALVVRLRERRVERDNRRAAYRDRVEQESAQRKETQRKRNEMAVSLTSAAGKQD